MIKTKLEHSISYQLTANKTIKLMDQDGGQIEIDLHSFSCLIETILNDYVVLAVNLKDTLKRAVKDVEE